MYSFYSNYAQTCLDNATCQSQIFNIDRASTVSVYALSTVGTTYMLSVEEQGVIPASPNVNGFAYTATSWTQ